MNKLRIPSIIAFLFISLLLFIFTLPTQAGSGRTACVDGNAAGFSCNNVDLLAHLPLSAIGGDAANDVLGSDIWGWTSTTSNRNYAIVGLRNATSFIDVTDPLNPIYLGKLPAEGTALSPYRDIKVYQDYAFIVGDAPFTAHGMQVFDLRKLDSAERALPVTFTEDAHYSGIATGHNLWINEATGFAYIFRSDKCSAATLMVDINDPLNPVTAGTGDGCLTIDGADSDAQCVTYTGPDSDYTGHEICFVGSDSTAGIGDVTDKDHPVTISNFTYPNIRRAHQGVLTADQRYWLISDTMDEMMGDEATTNTVIIDISDLDNPQYVRREYYSTLASDHNIYLKDNFAFMTNWRAGFRVADLSNFADWQEVAYFDTHPESDNPGAKHGSWSHYEAFSDDTIIVSDVERGLFLLALTIEPSAVVLGNHYTAPTQPLPSSIVAISLLLGSGTFIYFVHRKSGA